MIFVAENPDWFTLHHALSHVYLDRVIGVRVVSQVIYMPLCDRDVKRLALFATLMTQNVLRDALADLVFRRVLGERYWEEAVEEMKKNYALMQRPENIYFIGHEISSWLQHVIEDVYFDQAITREREAIKRYIDDPSIRTAIALLNTFVDIGRKVFKVDVNVKLRDKTHPAEY